MKILQLITRRQHRGAEIFAAGLSEGLVKAGHQVLFAGLYSPQTQNRLEVTGAVNLDIGVGPGIWQFHRTLRRLVALIRREKPDIIQSNGSDTLKFAVFALFFTPPVPLVYRNISVISSWLGSNPLKKGFYRWLFTKVDFVTSVGYGSLENLVTTLGYPSDRTRVIRRGIRVRPLSRSETRATLVKELGLPENSKIVVHAGNFSAEKNQTFLVDVFTRMKYSDPDVRLILVGEGSTQAAVRDQIERNGLSGTITMTGFRKDVDLFFAAADLLVLCSLIEGIPGVIVEAGVQGTPTLAVNVGGIPEVVADGVSGVLLRGFDAETFASNIIAMVRNEHEVSRMGKNAMAFAKKEFDPELNLLEFLQLYRSLLLGDGEVAPGNET